MGVYPAGLTFFDVLQPVVTVSRLQTGGAGDVVGTREVMCIAAAIEFTVLTLQ